MLKKFKNWLRPEKINEYAPMIVAFVRDLSDFELQEARKTLTELEAIIEVEEKSRDLL